jgi:putative transposase
VGASGSGEYLAAIRLHLRQTSGSRHTSLHLLNSRGQQGFREILGAAEGAKEDKSGWSSFLSSLKQRGLHGVKLIISDNCMGLVESLGEFFPKARWQRCTVHFYRNVFTNVPRSKGQEVAAMLKAIHAQEDREASQQKARFVIEKLNTMKLKAAAHTVEEGVLETLTYTEFPREHWHKIRTNNPMERVMREIRRRTRVVGNFPDGNSSMMLVTARLRYVAGRKWGTRKYMNMARLTGGTLIEEALQA